MKVAGDYPFPAPSWALRVSMIARHRDKITASSLSPLVPQSQSFTPTPSHNSAEKAVLAFNPLSCDFAQRKISLRE